MEPGRHSPSAMAPRTLFGWRSSAAPPSPPSPPLHPHATADAPLLSCDVWQPADPSFLTFGFGSKWTKASLALYLSCVADGAALPLLHLRLEERVYVVTGVHTHAAPHSDVHKEKQPIVLDVKAPEDVRRSLLYHTAAVSSVLTLYVDCESDAHHLTTIIREAIAVPTPPQVTRPASPPLPPAKRPQQRNVADTAAREMERALPTAPATESFQGSETVKPPPPEATKKPTETIETRLVGLQAFAHERDVTRAQRERRVHTDDLTLRLHALRNETPTPASEQSLTLRLQKLRGGGSDSSGSQAAATTTTTSVTTRTLSPVELIIQQAMDEVAMGIPDDARSNDVEGDDSDSDDDDSDDDESSSDSSSDDDGRSGRRRRDGRKPNAGNGRRRPQK